MALVCPQTNVFDIKMTALKKDSEINFLLRYFRTEKTKNPAFKSWKRDILF
jgi:hypothetical protein